MPTNRNPQNDVAQRRSSQQTPGPNPPAPTTKDATPDQKLTTAVQEDAVSRLIHWPMAAAPCPRAGDEQEVAEAITTPMEAVQWTPADLAQMHAFFHHLDRLDRECTIDLQRAA